MSWSSTRASLILACIAGILALAMIQQVNAQKRPPIKGKPLPPIGIDDPKQPQPPGPPKKKEHDLGNLTLPKDEALSDKLASAMDDIKRKDWTNAVDTLQKLLTRPQDVWVPIERKNNRGEIITLFVSVKRQSLELIRTMPNDGKDKYAAKYATEAENQYKLAVDNNDPDKMAVCVAKYLYTDKGIEAAEWLATYNLNRGQFQSAARYFGVLIARCGIQDDKNIDDKTLFKAALSFQFSGDMLSKKIAYTEMQRREKSGALALTKEFSTAKDVEDYIDKQGRAGGSYAGVNDSPYYRVDTTRSGLLTGGTPYLGARDWRTEITPGIKTQQQLTTAETSMKAKEMSPLCGFFPVTATINEGGKTISMLLYRHFGGIDAVNAKTGKALWSAVSDVSLDEVLIDKPVDENQRLLGNAYQNWLSYWLQSTNRPQILFENSILGTMSADAKRVYVIEDMPAPPPQHMSVPGNPNLGMAGYNWGEYTSSLIDHNKLQAYDLATGKLQWELGGTNNEPLSNSHFLGSPVSVAGRLYVLIERKQELRLVALNPETGKVMDEYSQTLATIKNQKLAHDPIRRIQAVHMSYSDGILVIPTNAGAVFGVDVMANSMVWAYPYRERVTPPNIGRYATPPAGWIRLPNGELVQASDTHWQVTAPAIVEGKAIITAPDGKGIHCVNLRDGSEVWRSARRNDDLFMAGVFGDKVVIVGKHRARALKLKNGDTEWELETGMPSGQGVAAPLKVGTTSNIIYYLPIRTAINTRKPEICAINVTRGYVHAHVRSRSGDVLGNLMFFDSKLISQSHNEVVCYPQLENKLAEMDKKVKDKPNDPDVLAERGDYRLDKGDLNGAIADFRKALDPDNKPDSFIKNKARTKLYEALTELFQRDFAAAESNIKEFEGLCKVDTDGKTGTELSNLQAEGRRRRANFLFLVGKGREAQGKLVDAFDRYLELGLEAKKDELIQVVDEPSVKAAPDVWAQGRIRAMVDNCKDADKKKELENKIASRWAKLKGTKASLAELRQFVSLFGSMFGVGKEARFALAERLMSDTDINSLLEAEQQLSLLRGDDEEPETAARAIEALARLNTKKGYLEDAAYYYRLLGQKYPKIKVDGKTGEDYLDDLATDKRFLPYLDQTGRFEIRGKVNIEGEGSNGSWSAPTAALQFAHDGEKLPFFRLHQLAFPMDYTHKLRLHNTKTGETKWDMALTDRTNFQQIAQYQTYDPLLMPYNNLKRFNYQTLGHLVVIQLGHRVFAIDPLSKNGRVLWSKNLSSLPGSATSPPYHNTMSIDPRDNAVVLTYSDGWMQRLGTVGPLQAGVVCMQFKDALTAIDPISGRVLWTRTDVSSRSHVFGDDKHIYVVDSSDGITAMATRVIRAYDGVTIKARDFAAEYDKRMRVLGRTIVVADEDIRGNTKLRVYDILKGKNLWDKTFMAGSVVMKSEDPRLTGVAEPNGSVHVIDLVTQKAILSRKITNAAHLEKVEQIYLVSDSKFIYMCCNGERDKNLAYNNVPGANLQQNRGLRAVPVNGYVYAFNKTNSAIQWYANVTNQQLVLHRFQELPVMLFTSRYQAWQNAGPFGGRTYKQVTEAVAIAKHNGKLSYDSITDRSEKNRYNSSLPDSATFHTIKMDNRTGKVEFMADTYKLTFAVKPR